MWPGYVGTMIRAHPQAGVGDEAVPAAEAINGLFEIGRASCRERV